MTGPSFARHSLHVAAALVALLCSAAPASAATPCPAVNDTPHPPVDKALCRSLEREVRHPSALPLDRYEEKLGTYVRNFCHRDPAAGWKMDKHIRDTGPFVATLQDEAWTGRYFGTHPAVLVWYSGEMYDWLRANRPENGRRAAPTPVPDGSIMIKEMYSPPAAACQDIDFTHLQPDQGVALMVRDRKASHDGWFWGWFGWKEWAPDWPAAAGNPYPNMGFGQYCTNCHASAKDNSTFASLRNIKGEPGDPLVFLSQHFFLDPSWRNQPPPDPDSPIPPVAQGYDPAFLAIFGAAHGSGPAPTVDTMAKLPSETYDSVVVPAGGPRRASAFVTSDQCVGCHDARGTGLQLDMTEPGPLGEPFQGKLWNVSPYATWRTSPMGLSGRDPIFFAQLASETESFHRGSAAAVEDVCLGCHGIGGQRQFTIDRFAATGGCEKFLRRSVDAVPFPDGNPQARMSSYGALARDGITCAACHHMALGKADTAKYRDAPQNKCVSERQAFLNPELVGFAKTFTGSFLLGAPDVLFGPFSAPKPKPMKNALGITPEHYRAVQSSELCGSCHVVHLPVLHHDKTVAHVYEQTTYAEWAFSDYRTGTTPDGELPSGPGARPQSCQDCHMPSRGVDGKPYLSKIAGIQEYSNFPQAENTLPARDIDLQRRDGYAKHTLAGLNVFLTRMAQQFPDVLGIRSKSPMLTKAGIDPVRYTEKAMLDQAGQATASISIGDITVDAATLSAAVTVTNKAGHKFPSGVGFRRAFVEFSVLGQNGDMLWSSGRTDGAGVIVDHKGAPVAGELWWSPDCSARVAPEARAHQPHFERIDRQDQAQIYEELVAMPGDVAAPACGAGARAAGALTTSFLSQCAKVKDNRILPHGFLPATQRAAIASALGAGDGLAEDAGPTAVGEDADYRTGGADTLAYRVPLADIAGAPVSLRATLYYQATPPYFLQDRFCTSKSPDTQRLYFLAGNLELKSTPAQSWKLEVVTTGDVALPR